MQNALIATTNFEHGWTWNQRRLEPPRLEPDKLIIFVTTCCTRSAQSLRTKGERIYCFRNWCREKSNSPRLTGSLIDSSRQFTRNCATRSDWNRIYCPVSPLFQASDKYSNAFLLKSTRKLANIVQFFFIIWWKTPKNSKNLNFKTI